MTILKFVTPFFLAMALTSCVLQSPETGWRHVKFIGTTPPPQRLTMPTKVISFETNEGTRMNVDVSPDGQILVFDLLGDIYLLPINGGDAVPVTSGRAWDQAPRFSPDGNSVFLVSDRKGRKNIWQLTLFDQSLSQVTRANGDLMGTPNWSQDENHLLAGLGDPYTLNTEVILQSIDPATGDMTSLENVDGPWINMDTLERKRDRIITFSGVQTRNGEVYFAEANLKPDGVKTSVQIYKLDIATQKRELVTLPDGAYNEFKPQLSNNGKLLAYFRQYPDRRTELRILSIRNGRDTLLAELSGADDADYRERADMQANYAFTPDDLHIIFSHGGKIHRLNLAEKAMTSIPFHAAVKQEISVRAQPTAQKINRHSEAKIIRWPGISQDGKTIVFAAIGYIWVMDAQTGDVRRMTDSSDFEYMPALSPDGNSVAYIAFRESNGEYGSGRLMIASVDGGKRCEVISGEHENYFLPRWSTNGERIALIRELRTDTDVDATIGWISTAHGVYHVAAKVPAAVEFPARFIFSRFVSFDETGKRLLFSFPTSANETVLASSDLNGDNYRTLAIGTPDVGGITPAPDLKHLALTRRDDSVWIVPFSADENAVSVSASATEALRMSGSDGYYLGWNRADEVTFGFGQNFYRYHIAARRLEARFINLVFEEQDADPPIAFIGARLITLSGDRGKCCVIDVGAIVMDEQRITALGPQDQVKIPANAVVIDVTGKTILPGLLDTHYHTLGGNRDGGFSALKLPNTDFSDPSAIAYGITTAWETGGASNDGVPATAELQLAGRIVGPRWSYGAKGGLAPPYDALINYGVAFAAAEQSKRLGATVLKEYNAPTREQRQWLVAAAHKHGLGIVSHIDHLDGFLNRIVDGYTGGDHPHIPTPLYKDVQELLKRTGYIWTPNIVITSGTVGANADKNSYYWRQVLKKRPDELKKLEAITGKSSEVAEPSVPYELHRVARLAKAAADAAKAGVHIGVSAHNMPGSNLHQEMWYLWKGGMPIEDVLRATTIGNAEKLGLQEEVGSLEVGKLADFLVLDENPLDDIINTLSLKYTIQGGVIYDADTAERVDAAALGQRLH